MVVYTQVAPEWTTAINPTPTPAGSAVTDTATVTTTGGPTTPGTVSFTAYNTNNCTGTVVGSENLDVLSSTTGNNEIP